VLLRCRRAGRQAAGYGGCMTGRPGGWCAGRWMGAGAKLVRWCSVDDRVDAAIEIGVDKWGAATCIAFRQKSTRKKALSYIA
jgi:hypothetical protein